MTYVLYMIGLGVKVKVLRKHAKAQGREDNDFSARPLLLLFLPPWLANMAMHQ